MKNKLEDQMERLINEIDSGTLLEDIFDADISDINPSSNQFSVNGHQYEISIQPAKSVLGAFIGSCRLTNNVNRPQFRDFDGDVKKYLKAREDGEMGNVNVGKSGYKIIGKVMTFFRKYIEENRPRIFIFHATEDVRAKHYFKLGKKLAARVGYELISKKDQKTGITEFWIYSTASEEEKKKITESISQYRFIQNYL